MPRLADVTFAAGVGPALAGVRPEALDTTREAAVGAEVVAGFVPAEQLASPPKLKISAAQKT